MFFNNQTARFRFVTITSLVFCSLLSFHASSQENLYAPDTSIIAFDSINFSDDAEVFNPSSSVFYQTFDTLYIRRQRQDMNYFRDTLLLVLEQNFFPPVNGPVISQYGPRGKRIHTGIDLRLNEGDTVYAAFDGVVRISRVFSGYGKFVLIRHENGLETAYAHFSKLLVSAFDTVKAGDPIGLGGRTGRATCNHLHFETRLFGEPMNPNIFFDFSKHELKKDTFLITASSFSLKNQNHQIANTKSANSKPVISASAGVNNYVIKQGDTLYSLARRYGTTVKVLCELNQINESKTLRIGQVIKVPVR
jgi:murein DD-endopeptidase MepM/ murein hydrolase activator NlpD